MPTLAIYALIALGIFTAGAGSGFKVESWRWSAAELAQQAEIVAERNAAEAKQAAASAALEKQKESVRVEYQTITKEVTKLVDRPVYRNVCLDDDGLRLANRALSGSDPAGQPHPAVPAAGGAR
jgi:hypothetical protein